MVNTEPQQNELVLLYTASNAIEAYSVSVHLKANYIQYKMKDETSVNAEVSSTIPEANSPIQVLVSTKDKVRASRVLVAKGFTNKSFEISPSSQTKDVSESAHAEVEGTSLSKFRAILSERQILVWMIVIAVFVMAILVWMF